MAEGRGAPLVVDWKPEERTDLEIAMRHSLAVVEYTCGSIRVLSDCKADGEYGFNAVTIKQQAIQLRSGDELRANLPRSGVLLGAKLEAELKRGASLEIGMAMIGRYRTTRGNLPRATLKGECKGATHFVRGATLGAFAMQVSADATAHSVAEIFDGGVRAGSSSSRSERSSDGVLAECDASSPEDKSPPKRCAALLRLELVALADVASEPSSAAPASLGAEDAECPDGMVMRSGKCTRAGARDARTCRVHDVTDCSAQCQAGSAKSCALLAWDYREGMKVSADGARALELYARGCALGLPEACAEAGEIYWTGKGGVPEDPARAADIFSRSCEQEVSTACWALHFFYESGQGGLAKDPKRSDELKRRAFGLYDRDCKAGDLEACNRQGVALANGWIERRDAKRAAELFQRACDGGDPNGCRNLGEAYAEGEGVAKDKVRAAKLFKTACDAEDVDACGYYGWVLAKGLAGERDLSKGTELVRKACNWRQAPVHCDRLSELSRK